MKKILIAGFVIAFSAGAANAACTVEKKIGSTWLCKGGKAIWRGMDTKCSRGTWKRISKTKVQICLPDEACKPGCETKNG